MFVINLGVKVFRLLTITYYYYTQYYKIFLANKSLKNFKLNKDIYQILKSESVEECLNGRVLRKIFSNLFEIMKYAKFVMSRNTFAVSYTLPV